MAAKLCGSIDCLVQRLSWRFLEDLSVSRNLSIRKLFCLPVAPVTPMSPKSVLVSASAIALSFVCLSSKVVGAQSIPVPAPEKSTLGSSTLGADLKLNAQQRKAIATMSEFAFEQIESILANGFDPNKLNRAETQQKAANLQQVFSSFRLDKQQKEALRAILQSARVQMKRQIEGK